MRKCNSCIYEGLKPAEACSDARNSRCGNHDNVYSLFTLQSSVRYYDGMHADHPVYACNICGTLLGIPTTLDLVEHIFRAHYHINPAEKYMNLVNYRENSAFGAALLRDGDEVLHTFILSPVRTRRDMTRYFVSDPYLIFLAIIYDRRDSQHHVECVICGNRYEEFPAEEIIIQHAKKCSESLYGPVNQHVGLLDLQSFMEQFTRTYSQQSEIISAALFYNQ